MYPNHNYPNNFPNQPPNNSQKFPPPQYFPNNNFQTPQQNPQFPPQNIQSNNFYFPPQNPQNGFNSGFNPQNPQNGFNSGFNPQNPNQNQSQGFPSPQQDYASRIQNFQNSFNNPFPTSFNQALPTHFSQTYVRNPLYQETSHPTFTLQKENFVHEFSLEDERDTQDHINHRGEEPRPFDEHKKDKDEWAVSKEQMRISHAFRFFKRQNSNFTEFVAMMSDLEISGGKFTDKDFPPAIESLIGRNKMREIEWGNFVWLRPDDFYGKRKYEIFAGNNPEIATSDSRFESSRMRRGRGMRGGMGRGMRKFDPSFIDPSDIHQGILGDCYFLSTLSSLAESPERIRKLFATTSVNFCGCYCIKVCEMGEWKKIIVDDYFPCDPETKKPVFTTGDNELWVLILEKAWAKIYGSYDAIESGLTRECLHDLTGAPTKFFLTSKRDQWEYLWSKLIKGEKKHYVMTCDTPNSVDPNMMNPLTAEGLVLGHAYSLLDAYEVESQGEKIRLVKLRNPWGYAEWNGDWSDNSSKWTEELKEKLKVEDKDDGIFYMDYEDFLEHFEKVQFCYVHDDNHYVSHRASTDGKNAVYFKITIEKEGKYYITINQESRRKNAYNPEFEYSTASIVIGKVLGNGQYQYVASTNGADKEVWVKCPELTPGEYIVYAKVKWAAVARNHDFVISSYGPAKAEISIVEKDKDFLDKTLITKARESQRKTSFVNLGEPNCFRALDTSKDGFIYCYYENLSNKTLKADVYFKEFKGIKLRKPFRGQEFQLLVPPQEERIVLIRILPKQTAKQVLDEKITFLAGEGDVKDALENIQQGNNNEGKKPIIAVPNFDAIAKSDGDMKRLKDSVTNAFLNMRVYTYRHDDGVYLFWENLTKDLILDQKVEYELDGLEPIGEAGEKESQFELKPGATNRLAFRKIGEPGTAVFKYDSRSRKE